MRTAAILGFVMAIFGATASSATEQPVYSVVEKTGAVMAIFSDRPALA